MAAVTETQANPRNGAPTFKVVGRVGTRFILQSPINSKLEAIPASFIEMLNKLGMQVEDKTDDYIL